MSRAGVALALAMPLVLGACAATMQTAGSARLEQLAATATPVERVLRAEGRSVMTLPLATGALVVDVAPSVVRPLDAGGTARERLRVGVALQPNTRAVLQPSAIVGWEQGVTRASDIVGESFEPRPDGLLLRNERLSGDVGVRWRQTGRHTLTAALGVERNGGFGVDARVLPMLTRATARIGSARRVDARTSLTLSAGADRVGLAGSPNWLTVAVGAAWTRQATRRSSIGLDLGGLVPVGGAESGLAMRMAARIHLAAAGAAPGLDVTVGQGPELDRLDGRIRQRRRAEIGIEKALVPAVSVRGTVQGLFDVGGVLPRRTVGGQVVARAGLGALGDAEVGVAHLMLMGGAGAAREETRLTVGLRVTERGRRCRSSC